MNETVPCQRSQMGLKEPPHIVHADTPKKGSTCVDTQGLQLQQRGCVILVRLGCDIVIATQECGVLLGDEHLSGVSFGIATMYLPIFRAK